jgi:hypothetical protein
MDASRILRLMLGLVLELRLYWEMSIIYHDDDVYLNKEVQHRGRTKVI